MQSRIESKWKKMLALQKSPKLSRHIPKTMRMTRLSLKSMLDLYRMVYIKPNKGTFGDGVGRVEKKRGNYHYQIGVRSRSFKSYSTLYRDIMNTIGRQPYLVQQGIHLLKYRGRRFDIRVMVQENPNKLLETTGIIGRVAHPKKIVTNYHSGGQLKPAEVLLSSYLPNKKIKKYCNQLKKLGLHAGHFVRKRYPGVKEAGVDIAIDHRLFPWILEVNTRPDSRIFKSLKDKSIYRKVVRYARAYGRFKLKPMRHTR